MHRQRQSFGFAVLFHQHFATGKTPSRFIRLGSRPGNEVNKLTSADVFLTRHDYIYFREQDPYIMELFKKELSRNGAPLQMPPLERLIALEEEATRMGPGSDGYDLFLQGLTEEELELLYGAK